MTEQDRVIYTVGHSNHPFEVFVGLLKKHGVTAVGDVRSSPYSRTRHFGKEELSAALKREGIVYVFLGKDLGARREEPEAYEENHVDFQRVAELPAFREGLDRLLRGMAAYRIALLCAEKEPLDCHRTILICKELKKQ